MLKERTISLEKEKKALEEKIDLKEKKIEEILEDKEFLLKEKSEILQDKNDMLENLKEKELLLQEQERTLGELKEKFKKSSSELLSKTMQIEKFLKKDKDFKEQETEKHEEFEQKTKELEDKVNELQKELEISEKMPKEVDKQTHIENVSLISGLDEIFKKIKELLPEAKSNIRLIIPNIQNIKDYELINVLKGIPNKVRISIATSIENPIGDPLLRDLKNFCQVTNYSEKKFIALNIDSSKFLFGTFSANKVIGIHCDVLEILEIFKPAIMEPFIKGRKV